MKHLGTIVNKNEFDTQGPIDKLVHLTENVDPVVQRKAEKYARGAFAGMDLSSLFRPE